MEPRILVTTNLSLACLHIRFEQTARSIYASSSTITNASSVAERGRRGGTLIQPESTKLGSSNLEPSHRHSTVPGTPLAAAAPITTPLGLLGPPRHWTTTTVYLHIHGHMHACEHVGTPDVPIDIHSVCRGREIQETESAIGQKGIG